MPQHPGISTAGSPGMRLPGPERVPSPLFATGDAAGQHGHSQPLPRHAAAFAPAFQPASTGDGR